MYEGRIVPLADDSSKIVLFPDTDTKVNFYGLLYLDEFLVRDLKKTAVIVTSNNGVAKSANYFTPKIKGIITVSEEEMDVLRCGNIPQAMEDKWFWYMEGSTLWAHRSWTGYCIYRIDFKEDNNHLVTVNRDPEQYGCTDIEEDIESLNNLLDWWARTPYDYYSEWLSETHDALEKAGKV